MHSNVIICKSIDVPTKYKNNIKQIMQCKQ